MEAGKIYCTSCGAANEEGAQFCFKCGSPIKIKSEPTTERKASDFITLSCPNCGGKLQVGTNMERFTCQFCGLEHLVRHTGSAISLAPVVEGLNKVVSKFDQVLSGSDRGAAEQTIQRLKNEMPAYEKRVADKQAQLKRASIKPGRVFFTILLSIPALIMWYGLTTSVIDRIKEPRYSTLDNQGFWILPTAVTLVIVGLCALFIVLLWRRKIPAKKQEKLDAIQSEIEQAQAELFDRRKQLEQLHRYTAER